MERPNMQAIIRGVRPLWSVASTGTPAYLVDVQLIITYRLLLAAVHTYAE